MLPPVGELQARLSITELEKRLAAALMHFRDGARGDSSPEAVCSPVSAKKGARAIGRQNLVQDRDGAVSEPPSLRSGYALPSRRAGHHGGHINRQRAPLIKTKTVSRREPATSGNPCLSPAMVNGRCRMHGGASTGPRTAERLARIKNAQPSTAAAQHRPDDPRQLGSERNNDCV
jgi:hypothetical protein